MVPSSRVLGLVVAVALVLASHAVQAGPKEDAVVLADRGFDLMEQQRFGDAAASFEEAASLYYSPVIALSWARAEEARGELVKAREVVRTIEDNPVPDDAKPSWTKAVREAAIFGVELDGRIPTITVTGDARKITVDRKPVAAGDVIAVDPGAHTVRWKDEDGESRRQRVVLAEQEARTVTTGAEGGVDAPEPSASLVGPIIAYSVAGVGFVLGTVTGIIFIGKANELEDSCPANRCPPGSAELIDEATALGNVSTVAWVFAGLGAVAGTVLLFVPLGGEGEPAVVVRARPFSGALELRF